MREIDLVEHKTSQVIAILLIVVSAGMVLYNTPRESNTSTNVMSRWATVEALVDHGTWSIDDTKYVGTIDKVMIDGRLYSSKPPLLSLMTAGVYAVYGALTGDEIGRRESRVTWVCKAFTVFFWYVLLLIYFVRVVRLFVRRPEAQAVVIAALCFAYLGAGYATTLNNHSPAALLGMMAFYHAYRARHEVNGSKWQWIFAGLAAGAIPAIDLPLGALSAGLAVYLFSADRRRTLRLFLPAMLPFLALHIGLSWAVTGSIVPVYLRAELYQFPGSYWDRPRGVFALDQPKGLYAFHLLLGHHGFFTMTPLLILAVLGLLSILKRRGSDSPEAILIGSVGLVLFSFYVLRTSNYGGRCLGVRWLVSYAPLLLLFFGSWLDRRKHLTLELGMLIAILFLVSQFNVLEALDTPWQEGRWHELWRSLTTSQY